MASDRFSNERYVNWLKAKLSLLFAKEGLEGFTDTEVEHFHNDLCSSLQTPSSSSASLIPECNVCVKGDLQKQWHRQSFRCPNNICDKWLKSLQDNHATPATRVEWDNFAVSRLPADPWECAKVYLPYGSSKYKCAKDADIAALLTLYLDCRHFHRLVGNIPLCEKIKEVRNEIFHSGSMEIDTAKMNSAVGLIIDLLEDPTTFAANSHCKEAVSKIQELLRGKVELSLHKELELKALNGQIQTLGCKTEQMKANIDGLTKDVHILKDEDIAKRKSFEDTKNKIVELQKVAGMLSDFLKDSGIEKVDTRQLVASARKLSEIKADVDKHDQQLRQLEKSSNQHERKLDQHEQKLGQHEQKLGQLDQGSRKLEEKVNILYQRRGLKHQLENPESMNEAKRGRCESQEPETADITSIQQHLIFLYNRHCQRVPIFPLQPEWREHVADLFVTPSMTIMNPRGIRVQQTFNKQGLVSHGESRETRVENIRDIFYNSNTLCRDIFIVGDSGNGKSVLCEYLVHMWVRVHSPNVQSLAEEKFMEIFTFLFYISLPEASRHPLQSNDVQRMIKSQLNLEHVDLSKLISDHKCLIILDGLDEFSPSQKSRNTRFGSPSLPERPLSEKSTVLTTSRPWKLEVLAIELEGKIDRKISLRGIEMKSQLDLVIKIVSLLNSQCGRDEKSQHFFDEVKDKNLAQYLQTPILLTQMLGLWFSGESIGRSQCSIYSAMINKQLQFTEEVKQRGLPTALQKEEQTESKTTGQDQLPTCFTDQAYCQKHKSLLLKLSRLAYECLFSKNKENSLVFGHQQMEICGMSKDEIQTSLQMGLVTQYKVFGEITQRLRSISFIHKSHQEFFAAVYLSQEARASDLKQLLESFSDLDRVLEIEKVFTFVSGMSPKVSCEIAKVIMDKASGDFRVQQYRQSCAHFYTPHEGLVKQIQGVILAGIEEGKIHGQKITGIQLQDLWMKNEDRDFPPSRVLACTQSLELSHVQSIYIHTPGDDTQGQIWRLIEASRNLHKIVLYDCDISVDKIQKVVRRNPGTLQALGLYHVKRDDVDFSRLGRNDLKEILSASESSLGLRGVTLTHAQLEFLCRHLSECSYSEVSLGRLRCTTHGDRAEDCKQRVDLSASKNISRLELHYLPVQEVVFIPENLVSCVIAHLPETVAANAIRCLSNAVKLEKFECWGLRDSALVELARTLPLLLNLKLILLVNINLSGHEAVLCTPDMKQLEVILLYKVTVTSGHLQSLLSTIPSHRVGVLLGHSNMGPLTITSYSRTNDILQQIRDNPNTHVTKDEVEYEGDKCVVKQFEFYTSK